LAILPQKSLNEILEGKEFLDFTFENYISSSFKGKHFKGLTFRLSTKDISKVKKSGFDSLLYPSYLFFEIPRVMSFFSLPFITESILCQW